MPTDVYQTNNVVTFDGEVIEIIPLKIKYLKQVMKTFSTVKTSKSETETLGILSECVRICMQQYAPELSRKAEDIEDNFDLDNIYDVLSHSAGIQMRPQTSGEEAPKSLEESTTWEDLDLAKLESEVFLLGIWKNFDDLEKAISIEELMLILSTIRDLDYEEKKFMAALQGVDLDEGSGNSSEVRGQQEWENLKAKVFSGNKTTDANDVISLQGQNARKAGFGIGFGLGYEDMRDPSVMKTE
jgi:hypothetical protein